MTIQVYPCPHCKAEFHTLGTFRRHLASNHGEPSALHKDRCSTCDDRLVADMAWLDEEPKR